MPRKTCVKNLQILCLENVVTNFESFWFKFSYKSRKRKTLFKRLFRRQSLSEYTSSGVMLYPFEHLTGDLNRDLINMLICNGKLKFNHFNVLLNSCLTELDLKEAPWIVDNHMQDSVIDIIASRCPRLVKLNLDEFHHTSPKRFINLTSRLTALKYLSLKHTQCDDNVINSIGSNCKGLLELDCTECRLVTDTGMKLFIESYNGEFTMFKNLVLLKMFYTNVSSFILSRIILLRGDLDIQCGREYEVINEAFKEQFVPGEEVPKTDQLPLKLMSNWEQLDKLTYRQVDIVTTYCPNITEVIISDGISDDCLPALGCLKQLHKLNISCGKIDTLTFQHGVLPFLTDIGHQLLQLTLFRIKDICLDSVGACCLNLQKLNCSLLSITTEYLPSNKEALVFSYLTHLEIEVVSTNIIFPQYTLKNILVNAKKIKEINFFYMSHLTTELLLEILEKNTFDYLCKLILRYCHNLTAKGVMKLLSLENDLSEFTIINCDIISHSDFQNFDNYIKLNRLNVKSCWR